VTEPVRVLSLIKGLGPGGAERLLVAQASAGDRERFHHDIAYVLDWKRHLVPELDALRVPTHCLGVHDERDPRWAIRLAGLLSRDHYDIVHAHSPMVAPVARVAAKARPKGRRPAFVYTEHNRWPSYRTETRLANQLTFGLNDAVFAVSEDVLSSVSLRYRADVEVVIHGVDVARVRAQLRDREETRRALGVLPGESLAVTVANLRDDKNYAGLIDAARLVTDRGTPVRFATAGQGPLEAQIRELQRRSGLGDRFALLGYRDDATRLIAAADLFVLASHHEGLPVTVMEALTLGVPVVAPAVGGLPEVVTSGSNGILVAARSAPALADAITQALEPGVHAQLVAGASSTGDRFSAQHAVARVEAAYAALAPTPRS
jgi:glycosyltransferase involved in cell wall biosynthesis